MQDDDQILLIDAIGPFFRHYKSKRINWSKVPFYHLENESGLREGIESSIIRDFETFVVAAKKSGFNSISIDDVAHLILVGTYPDTLQRKIKVYQSLYRELLAIADRYGMRVFFTMDVMFFNETLEKILGNDIQSSAQWLAAQLSKIFASIPDIAGVIMRFGEKDGLDVKGDFKSRLILKRVGQARKFLNRLLPIFEKYDRLLIFRTWSVGAYSIGDLIWNPKTFRQVFADVDSPALVISMKYGESDFFRYLSLNRNFFQSDHKKIIEFQARREYEGFGAYPSFVGWDVANYLSELRTAKNMVGVSVWCQTGGWGKLRQLTFIRNSSVWVELNAFVIAQLAMGSTCEKAIHEFMKFKNLDVPLTEMVAFLKLSDEVITKLLYVPELGRRQLFFRRLRLPPQLFVFWDRIMVDHTMKRVLSYLVTDREQALRDGREGLEKLNQMIAIAERTGIPTKGLDFQLATFEIIAAAREYFFSSYNPEIAERLKVLKKEYKREFKRNYSVVLNFDPAPIKKRHLHRVLNLLLRGESKYRLIDQIITLRVLAWIYPIFSRLGKRAAPKFANQQAMGIDVLFK